MTLFSNVSVTASGAAINVSCLAYHCHFNISGIPAESTKNMQI